MANKMSSKPICQVGIGYWGRNLIRNLNSLNILAAAFDKDQTIIDKYSKDLSYRDVHFDTDWEKSLSRKSIKGIVIATPPKTHYDIAVKALEAGKHVFIEKPMTIDVKESEAIVKLAEEKGLIVMVGHIFLYSPETIKLKEIISSPNFGEISYIYTKRLNLGQVQACGVVNDLMPHDVSIIDYLLDKKCTQVSAYGFSNVLNKVEDVAFINLKYGDTSAQLHLSWLDPLKVRDTVVVGTKQMAVCDSINKKIDVYNKGVDLSALEDSISIDYARHLLTYKYGDIVSPYINMYEPLMEECKEFLSCIEEERTPLSDGKVGLSVVKVLSAAQQSLKASGMWVNV